MSTLGPRAPSGGEEPALLVRCARHPGTETALRCGRCDTPICPRCLVSTPVGARCPTCAPVKRFAFLVKPRELVRAAALGLAVAATGSLIVSLVPFLGLLGLAALGFAVGEAVSLAANRKRARELAVLAVGCLFVGYALGPSLGLALRGHLELLPAAPLLVLRELTAMLGSPLLLVGLLVGALLAWMRVR